MTQNPTTGEPGVSGSAALATARARDHKPLARVTPRIALRLGEARSAIRGLREDGPTSEALDQCARILSEMTGAAAVVITAGRPAWHVARPHDLDPSACLDRLARRSPSWHASPLLPLIGHDAADILERPDVGQLIALPLDDETLGPRAVLLLGWGAAPYPADDDLPALRALADQIALALAAASIDRALRGGARHTGEHIAEAGPPVAPLPPADELISFFAHELRAPLTPMTMLLQTVERKAATGTFDFESLTRVQRQIVRITRTIGDLVDLSRLRQGKLRVDRAPVDLGAMLDEIADLVRPTLLRHALEVELVDKAVVSGDRMRLERVVLNLLEQGERMSPNGGTLRIELRARQGRVHLAIATVANPSPASAPVRPIPKVEHVRHVGSYSQLVGPNLGMFLAETVTELHGGRLSIDTGTGGLPTLVVDLPAT